jgi:UDP-glucuronate 4-epimerase
MDMIESIENSLGKKAIKIFEPMQKGDVVETFADIDQSIKKLNFSPNVKLQDGIDRFVKWYLEKN